MSAEALDAVFAWSQATEHDRLVLIAIAHEADDNGRAMLTLGRITRRTALRTALRTPEIATALGRLAERTELAIVDTDAWDNIDGTLDDAMTRAGAVQILLGPWRPQ